MRAKRTGALAALALLIAAGALVAWAAFAPIALASRDELFAIPHGTWARRMAGDQLESSLNLFRGILSKLGGVPR